MQADWDVIVVGAGPAGMACATAAAGAGLGVLVLDEQPAPGGQIYRNVERQPAEVMKVLGPDYAAGLSLVRRFRESSAVYLPGATVWKLEADGRVAFSRDGASEEIRARRLVIATGAMERPVPFPGWTLPGVVGAGAVDALFKGDGIVPEGPVTMAGSGPLMLLVAPHLRALKIPVHHLYDTTSRRSLPGALAHLPRALGRAGYLLKGAAMLARTRLGVGGYTPGIARYAAEGEGRVERVSAEGGGKRHGGESGMLLVHEGIVPRTEFTRQLGLDHLWDPVQRYWHPALDAEGRTSCPTVFMAGDGGFVHGAVAAGEKGAIAGLAVARDLGRLSPEAFDRRAARHKRTLRRELLPRPFVDALYRPRPELHGMEDHTTVCRCEEVSAGEIRGLVAEGHKTPEMVKAVTRCGMGPCQGRMCGSALAELVTAEAGIDIRSAAPPRVRPPVRNIGLGELVRMTLLPKPGGMTDGHDTSGPKPASVESAPGHRLPVDSVAIPGGSGDIGPASGACEPADSVSVSGAGDSAETVSEAGAGGMPGTLHAGGRR